MKTGDQAGPRGGAFSPQMRLTDEGLELGRGVLLAKWDDAGLASGKTV
ncbi:hypothetical protein [Methylocella silvestris]|nr:hypothetical protein [Methylocella silvestris]